MSIIVCGINHKTAPIALRERVVFPVEKLPLYLSDLLAQENISEAVIVSTCNRSELYCETNDVARMREWFARQHQLTSEELAPYFYVYHNQQAIEHIMRVACGMDSLVLGETQILGQMKNAFSESCAAGVVGPLFNRLFQQVFAVAKEVRTNTSIGACPVSVASAAVALAKQLLPQLCSATVLAIGAGDTMNLVLRHLRAQSSCNLIIANRCLENAKALAALHSAELIPCTELEEALQKVDMVISATGSATPIITKAMMQNVIPKRQHPALTLIDLAVPRDVEASTSDFAAISLYCIDDLKSIIQHNLRGREHAAEKAQEVIHARSTDFIAWLRSYDKVASTIRAFRSQIEDICCGELAKANRQLQRGDDPVQVLAAFSTAFTNKLLHTPSVQLRQAGLEGRFDIVQLAQQLFAIPQTVSE